MKNIFLKKSVSVSLLCITSSLCGQAPEGYELFWADEFNGDALNEEEWAYRLGGKQFSVQKKENVSVEGGKLKIDLKKEIEGEHEWSAGGVISTRNFGHGPGYHEVSVKISKYEGWHESFWTTPHIQDSSARDRNISFFDSIDIYGDWVEFDVLEHYSSIGPRQTTAGAIHWLDNGVPGERKIIVRKRPMLDFDMSENFHTFGMELTPDYLIFYMDGEMLELVDMRKYPFHPFHAWLSCIAGSTPPAEDVMYYDYFRTYAISSENYEVRRAEVMGMLKAREEADAALYAKAKSNGNDLWMEVENFPNLGKWLVTTQVDTQFDRMARILQGQEGKGENSKEDLSAMGRFPVEDGGEYRLWVRSRDYPENNPGARKFKVLVNGEESSGFFGIHGQEGYQWEAGDTFTLREGMHTITLFDSEQFYPRVDKVLLTTDLDYVPEGLGGRENVDYALDF